jgi:hypothetical protein
MKSEGEQEEDFESRLDRMERLEQEKADLALPSHGEAPDRWFSPDRHGRKG